VWLEGGSYQQKCSYGQDGRSGAYHIPYALVGVGLIVGVCVVVGLIWGAASTAGRTRRKAVERHIVSLQSAVVLQACVKCNEDIVYEGALELHSYTWNPMATLFHASTRCTALTCASWSKESIVWCLGLD
jgi:hypothetical protein